MEGVAEHDDHLVFLKFFRGGKKIENIFKRKILSKYMNLHIPAFCDTNLDLIFDICFRNFDSIEYFRKYNKSNTV